LLPFGWTGTWAGVQSRDDALASREPGRSIAVRVHTLPNGASSETIVLWMHGGGMFMGSAAGEDALARFFCARLSTMVVSVAYRKAPEFAHPAALHDVLDAATALLAAHPHARLLLAGMSAGGYYAIQAALALGSKVVGHDAIAPMVGPFAHFLSVPRNDPISLFPARGTSLSAIERLAHTRTRRVPRFARWLRSDVCA
jgi:acetyl esterase/lipase